MRCSRSDGRDHSEQEKEQNVDTELKIDRITTQVDGQAVANALLTESLLTYKQRQTLRAALDTAIPPDDFPGAWDAGVGDYLIRQFTGDLKHLLDTYRACLNSLNQEAVVANGMAFASLDLPQRTLLFKRLEAGESRAEWQIPTGQFIEMLASHAAEGYYADPGNGGNRDRVTWDMIGFIVTA